MSNIDPTLCAILKSLPACPTREVPPGVAADLDVARQTYHGVGVYDVNAICHRDDTTIESPDGLERLNAEVLEYEVCWGDIHQGGGFTAYRCVVLTTYRRAVAHLHYNRVSQVFSSSMAVAALWKTLMSEGWVEV